MHVILVTGADIRPDNVFHSALLSPAFSSKRPLQNDRCLMPSNWLLLLACAKSHMLSASRRQPHLLHVSAVDRRQTWSMDKS